MDQKPFKQSPFFTWIYSPIIAPVVVGLVVALITGRFVIQITGFQFSIGITLIITLCIFLVIIVSFYLGMLYFIISLFGLFFKDQDIPLRFQILTKVASFILFPIIWIQKRRRKNHPPSEFTKRMLARLQEKKEQQNKPPATTTI